MIFQRKYSKTKYATQVNALFQEKAYCIRHYVQHVLASSDQAAQIGSRMMDAQRNIVHFVGMFDHERAIIEKCHMDYLQYIGEVIMAHKYKSGVTNCRIKWYEKADQLCKMLCMMSDWNLRSYIYKEIALIEGLIKSILLQDENRIEYYFNGLSGCNQAMSKVIIEKMITDYKNHFA